MKRFIALLLLVCCLLTACGQKPAAPEKLSVSLENGAAVISWAKSDEAETYRLYRRGQKDTDYKFIFDSDGDETAYTDRYVQNGETYTYKLEIIGEKGVSDAMETTLIMPEKEASTLPEKAPDTPVIDYVTPMDAFTVVVAVRPQENCIYAFYRAASESGDYALVSTRDEPFLYDEHRDEKLNWFYRVRALRADKESEMSQPQKTGYNAKTAFSVPVLMYHEFVTEDDLKNGIAFDEYAVYADEFESDLQWIQKNGYTTITTAQLVDYLSGKGKLPEKPIILTIDDGKYGVYKRAWPLLKKYKMKATLSLIGHEIDVATNSPSARDKSDAPFCNWTEVAEMQDSGAIELISHTDKLHYYTHNGRSGANTKEGDTLDSFLPIAQKDYSDITRSFRTHLHTTPIAMAYPYSERTELSDEAWLKSGFKLLYGGNIEDIRYSRSNYFIREAGLNKKSAVLRRVARMTGREITSIIDY